MSHHDLYKQRHQFFLSMSPTFRGGVTFAILLGLAAFAGGFVCQENTRTWGSLLFNLMFFFSIALGGVVFGAMQDVIGALWGRPIKRIHESFGAFLPYATVIMIAFLLCIKFEVLGAHQVYRWIADPHMVEHFEGKNVWLQPNFMIIRDIVAVLVIFGFATWHKNKTLAADKMLLSGKEDEARRIGEKNTATLRYWSSPVLFIYAIMFSVLCFDLTMSLAPTWMSTLWAGWSFALMMHTLMAVILLTLFAWKKTPMGHYYGQQQFHDVGKLMHGFTAFFAYLTYAHVLTYWYINMPEETSYFITRLEKPWFYFIVAAPILCFAIPIFALIPKANKWTAHYTIPISLLIIVAQWLNYMMVVIPEVADAKTWTFPWIELGLFVGFLGLFVLSIYQFGRKIPMLAIGDPLLKEALKAHH